MSYLFSVFLFFFPITAADALARTYYTAGGDAILQDWGGKDATEMFRSVQHSPDAISIRPNFMVARLKKKAVAPPPKGGAKGPAGRSKL